MNRVRARLQPSTDHKHNLPTRAAVNFHSQHPPEDGLVLFILLKKDRVPLLTLLPFIPHNDVRSR